MSLLLVRLPVPARKIDDSHNELGPVGIVGTQVETEGDETIDSTDCYLMEPSL